MVIAERKYMVEVGEIGSTELFPLTVRFQTPNPDLMEFLLQMFPQWLHTKEEEKCPHIHGGITCSCQRQCQRKSGHKGNHYYAWSKALDEQRIKERGL